MAAALLGGPRGRRVCLELARRLAVDDEGAYPPPVSLADELAAIDLRRAAAYGDRELVAVLAASVDRAMYWQPPDDDDRDLAEPALRDALRPAAAALARCRATRWWLEPVVLDDLWSVTWASSEPAGRTLEPGVTGRLEQWRARTVAAEEQAQELPGDPAAPYSGYWWSTPTTGTTVRTVRRLGELGPVGLDLQEDSMGLDRASAGRLLPRPGVRVYEVDSPEAYAALVERYPLVVTCSRRHDWWRTTGVLGDPWLIPDYAAVGLDYDAVHLTVLGYLATAGRAIPAAGGSTLLAGWDPDVTYWLADVLEGAGRPVRWRRTERDEACSWVEE